MRGEEILERHRSVIESLCRRYGVTRLRVFGSALPKEWSPKTSDFDVLVDYGPDNRRLDPLDRLVGFQLEMEKLLGHPVDAVDWGAAKTPYFRAYAAEQAQDFHAA